MIGNPANGIYYAYGRVNDYGNSPSRFMSWGDGNTHNPGFDSRGERIMLASTDNAHTITGFEGNEWRGWGGASLDGTDTYELFGNYQNYRSADGLSNFERGSSGIQLAIRQAEFCFAMLAAIPGGQSGDVYTDFIGTPDGTGLMGDTFKAPVNSQSDDIILIWARSTLEFGPPITSIDVGNNLENTDFTAPWTRSVPGGNDPLWFQIVQLDYVRKIGSFLSLTRFPDTYSGSAIVKIWENGQVNEVDTFVFFDETLWQTITRDNGNVNENPSDSGKYTVIKTQTMKSKPTAVTGILADFELPIHRWDASDASFVVQSGQQDISHAYTLSDLNKRLTANVPELVIHLPALTDSSPNNSIIRYNHTGSALDVLTGDTTIGVTFEEAAGNILSRSIIYAGTGIQIPANSEAEIGMAGAAVSFTLSEGDSILIDIADSRNPETSDTFYYGNNFGFTADLDVVSDDGTRLLLNTTGTMLMIDGNNSNRESLYQKGIGARGILKRQIDEGKIIPYAEGIRLIAGQTIVFKAIFFETLHDIAATTGLPSLIPSSYKPIDSFGITNDHLNLTDELVTISEQGGEGESFDGFWNHLVTSSNTELQVTLTYRGNSIREALFNPANNTDVINFTNDGNSRTVTALHNRIRTRANNSAPWGNWVGIGRPSQLAPFTLSANDSVDITFDDEDISQTYPDGGNGFQIQWNVSFEGSTGHIRMNTGNTALALTYSGRYEETFRVYFDDAGNLIREDLNTNKPTLMVNSNGSLAIRQTLFANFANGTTTAGLRADYRQFNYVVVTMSSHETEVVAIPINAIKASFSESGYNFTFASNNNNPRLTIGHRGLQINTISYV